MLNYAKTEQQIFQEGATHDEKLVEQYRELQRKRALEAMKYDEEQREKGKPKDNDDSSFGYPTDSDDSVSDSDGNKKKRKKGKDEES